AITATGGGRDSNILIRGSEITGGKNVSLAADNSITLDAAANSREQSSTSHSSNASIGVGFTFGESNGLTIEVAAGSQSGRDNGTDGTWTNTTIHAGQQVNITSGGDTIVRGATVSGNRINADVGGNLHIETLQDTSTYHSQNSGGGFNATICAWYCYGDSSVSVYANNMRGDGNFASATQQSGFLAGDGGFGVNVAGNTNLVGGVISSTDAAVNAGRNSFATGSLTTTDLVNHDTFQGSGYSVNFSTSTSGTSSGNVGIGSNDVNRSSLTQSGISGFAGNTAVRTGVDSTNGLRMTDRERAMREIGAQVTITSTASGQLIQLGPVAVLAALDALEGFFTPAPTSPGSQPLTPAQQARNEIEQIRSDPSLTEQQRAGLQGLENFLNAAEKVVRNAASAGDQVVQEQDPNLQNMQFFFPPVNPATGGAVGGAAAGSGIAAGGLQQDPNNGLLIPPNLSSLGELITPQSGSLFLVYQFVQGIMQSTVNAATGGGGGDGTGPTGGNGADTYGTPPNGASPPPDGDKNQNEKQIDERNARHIFREADGHLRDTPTNRQLLEDVANNPRNDLGTDKWGNSWHASLDSNGNQVWVQSRGGRIINGGINNPPRTMDPNTGLSSPIRPGK
ncbi:hemagglutinin repeat-containing protein, partial [Variovorax sp. Root318D1]|uniref:hemagglutinin repeat-containing protein n=1 Tax=Variovorax sp. Root318D1 TaxID=1736513 RepID=UPI000B0E7A5A